MWRKPQRNVAATRHHERVDTTFQVDLRGVVDLLSLDLYASPRVYVREPPQNAVDAVTPRRGRCTEAQSLLTAALNALPARERRRRERVSALPDEVRQELRTESTKSALAVRKCVQ